VEAVLAKKAEGRPVTPEEYQVLSQFVDRVERGLIHRRSAEKRAEDDRRKSVRETITPAAFELAIEDAPFSDRLYALLSEAGYQSVGDVMLQMALDPDAIMGLSGFGPKAMAELQETLAGMTFAGPEVEAPAVETPAVAEPELAEAPRVRFCGTPGG
jgi:N utilization substance protein A